MTQQPPGLLELPRHRLDQDLDFQLCLGLDHWLSFLQWAPDFSIETNRARWAHLEQLIAEQPVVGAIVIHRCRTETGYHKGAIHFRTPVTAHWDPKHAAHCWDVESWQPLTLAPSLLSRCPCNDHGFIRGGLWVRA